MVNILIKATAAVLAATVILFFLTEHSCSQDLENTTVALRLQEIYNCDPAYIPDEGDVIGKLIALLDNKPECAEYLASMQSLMGGN